MTPWHRRALIVEDETIVGIVLEAMMRELGYSVVLWAKTPAEALLHLSELPPPEIALTDLRLGKDTAVEVLERCAHLGIPILITTGYDPGNVPQQFQALRRLHKPFTLEDLRRELDQVVATKPQPDA